MAKAEYSDKQMRPAALAGNKKATDPTPMQRDLDAQEGGYHFAGEGLYRPMFIKAATYEEAVQIWKKDRVKVGVDQTPLPPEGDIEK